MHYTIDRTIGVITYTINPEITKAEMKRTDSLLNIAVNRYNIDAEKEYFQLKKTNPGLQFTLDNFTINLRYYKRQYVARYNSIGEKEVWVNCFCNTPDNDNWLMFITYVCDGGKCYFNATINLSQNKYVDFWANGQA